MSLELNISKRPFETWTSETGEVYLISRNPKKYVGCVMQDGKRFRFAYRSRTSSSPHNESFLTKEEAEEARRNFNLQRKFIKNLMIDKGDYVEMQITDDFVALIDHEDVFEVDNHLWHLARAKSSKHNYIKSKEMYLHDLILGSKKKKKKGKKMVVIHEDGNNLNHRRNNLILKKKAIFAPTPTTNIDPIAPL